MRESDGDNRTVANRIARRRLKCDRCPPHRKENANHKRRRGRKPRRAR